MPSDPYAYLLYEAINTDHGIIVRVEDPALLRQKLYVTKRTDPAFDCLAFVQSPTNATQELWIVKKPEVETDAQTPEL